MCLTKFAGKFICIEFEYDCCLGCSTLWLSILYCYRFWHRFDANEETNRPDIFRCNNYGCRLGHCLALTIENGSKRIHSTCLRLCGLRMAGLSSSSSHLRAHRTFSCLVFQLKINQTKPNIPQPGVFCNEWSRWLWSNIYYSTDCEWSMTLRWI